MITNERQYRITKAQADKFAKALESVQGSPPDEGIGPLLRQAEIEGIKSQLADLCHQVEEYELLKSGQTNEIKADSIDRLAVSLIQARVASGLTQKQLAGRLGLKEQQVQRYEATDYSGAKLSRVVDVVHALNVHTTIRLMITGHGKARQKGAVTSDETVQLNGLELSPQERERGLLAQKIIRTKGFWPNEVAA